MMKKTIYKEILKAYKEELSKDVIEIKQFATSWLNQEWFDDWIKYQSRSIDGLWQLLVIGPWRLTVWWPFLLIAYVWNRFVSYSFIPLLVITKSWSKTNKLIWLIEKFLKTFFGLFWITEAVPQFKKRFKEKWSLRIKRFQKFSKDFQRDGPKMVDEMSADLSRRVYDLFENNVLYGWTLVKAELKKVERRYTERTTAIRIVISMKLERVPHYMVVWKETWLYRFQVLKVWIKMPKEVVKCKSLRILRYIITGFRAMWIVTQGCLLTLEIIFVPEPISLNIRLYIKKIRYALKRIFIK